ncbi:MAG: hypothetical protein ACP5O1_10710, partial [Phycisphaerae bacterium]
RMRQIRTSGSEGGETALKAVFPTPIMAPRRPSLRSPVSPAVNIFFNAMNTGGINPPARIQDDRIRWMGASALPAGA